jgi:DNA-binding MarR family transcriptional regulator
MTRIVTGLERGGLARRMADPADARRVRICATAKGVRLLQQGRRRRIEYLARHLNVLDEAELESLRKAASVLEKVLKHW